MIKHLKATNQTYFNHMSFAFTSGLKMIYGGVISIIHSIVPDLFPFKAELIIHELIRSADKRRMERALERRYKERLSNGNQISKEEV